MKIVEVSDWPVCWLDKSGNLECSMDTVGARGATSAPALMVKQNAAAGLRASGSRDVQGCAAPAQQV